MLSNPARKPTTGSCSVLERFASLPLRNAARLVRAALPPRRAVRLRLTVADLIKSLGGYASVSALTLLLCLECSQSLTFAKKRVPPGGRVAVVVEERLSALRAAPNLRAKLIERMSRGRLVSIRGEKGTPEGLLFYRVAISRRTFGWVQSDAVVVPWRVGDDRKLLTLIENSEEFDRIARAKTFLDAFPHSPLIPRVLLIYASEAEVVADKLSRDAQRRFTKNELPTDGAPEFSYYLNYNGLDRYNREGVTFLFDRTTKKFSYDGAAWRTIIKRFPNSTEAVEARKRLDEFANVKTK